MNLEGLEMIAVLIVIVLFVKVLEQFGLIEAGLEGKGALLGGLSFFCSSSALVGTCEWGVRCCLGHPQPLGHTVATLSMLRLWGFSLAGEIT